LFVEDPRIRIPSAPSSAQAEAVDGQLQIAPTPQDTQPLGTGDTAATWDIAGSTPRDRPVVSCDITGSTPRVRHVVSCDITGSTPRDRHVVSEPTTEAAVPSLDAPTVSCAHEPSTTVSSTSTTPSAEADGGAALAHATRASIVLAKNLERLLRRQNAMDQSVRRRDRDLVTSVHAADLELVRRAAELDLLERDLERRRLQFEEQEERMALDRKELDMARREHFVKQSELDIARREHFVKQSFLLQREQWLQDREARFARREGLEELAEFAAASPTSASAVALCSRAAVERRVGRKPSLCASDTDFANATIATQEASLMPRRGRADLTEQGFNRGSAALVPARRARTSCCCRARGCIAGVAVTILAFAAVHHTLDAASLVPMIPGHALPAFVDRFGLAPPWLFRDLGRGRYGLASEDTRSRDSLANGSTRPGADHATCELDADKVTDCSSMAKVSFSVPGGRKGIVGMMTGLLTYVLLP